MPLRTILPALASIVSFALAYRFASHGIKLKDNLCIGLSCAAVAIGAALLWYASRSRRRERE